MIDRRAGTGMALAALLASTAACSPPGGAAQDGSADTAGASAPAQRVVNVEVLETATEPFDITLVVTGEVRPDRDVTVSSEETGVIRELLVERGTRVAEGQPLARIDDRVLRAQVDQARAEAAIARETWERQRRLWEEEQIGTELAYLQARYTAERADANARMLEARLERTVISAPIDGTVEDRFVEVGTMTSPGTPVARIVDADPLRIMAGVPERYAGEIRAGTARVSFENMSLGEFTGRISFVGTAVDDQTRTFPVEVRLANTGGRVKPGLVARVYLARGQVASAVLVPRDAVLRSETGYIVYVVEDQAGTPMAQARDVVTGAGDARRVVIEAGLAAGERVIVVGQQQVAHGDVVRITGTGGGGQ